LPVSSELTNQTNEQTAKAQHVFKELKHVCTPMEGKLFVITLPQQSGWWFQFHLNNIRQIGFIFPNFRGENPTIFETTT